jgi:feruloyl esterase
VWLPTTTWNGRLQAIGGGGFIAGLYGYMFIAMDAAIAEGYATVSSNAGIYATDINGGDAHTWALSPNGSVNYFMLENFAYRSVGEMTVLAHEVIKSYYEKDAEKSYFSGCSNGGRQAYALAQRYPDYYDGIAACAPGIFWDETVEMYWSRQYMDEKGEYPWPCEYDALRAAAIQACDGYDGIEDGILGEPDKCDFDPFSIVGEEVECAAASGRVRISEVAAVLAKAHWTGERPAGVDFRSQTGGYEVDLKAVAGTSCSNGTCVGVPGKQT